MKKITDREIDSLLAGSEETPTRNSLIKKLKSGKKLRIKYGVDPSGTDLHIGHAVNYEKLRQFQELGHQVVFVIGDFTARFGDPTDKGTMRTMKTKKETMAAAKNYLKQIGSIIDLKKTEVRYNGEWYDKMSAEDLARLMSRFTHAQLIQRDMFQRRMADEQEIGMHEMIYPILQGYDSVVLEADIALSGSDQLFNEMQGRKLQEQYGQIPQDIITMPILLGTDGQLKMGKSNNNYIALNDSADDMFGKVMSIPDQLMPQYFRLLTRISDKQMSAYIEAVEKKENMREIKFVLATEVTKNYHGEKKAEAAGKRFNAVFRDKQMPSNMPEVTYDLIPTGVVEFVHGLGITTSKGEARRLIEQGGLSLDSAKITDPKAVITPHKGMVVQAGKKKFIKIK
ncbi:MAG: tyrosine--tRNA ligase [Patescibacteria group bacterium]